MKKMLVAALAMMAMSFNVFAIEGKTLNFCGGAEGGFYESFAKQIANDVAKAAKVQVDVLQTEGSVSSAQMLKDGDCDVAILQADAVISRPLPADIAVSDAHREAIYWMFGKGGVKDFGDMSDKEHKNKGIAVVEGSGAEVTLRNFGNVDKDFKDLNVIVFDDWFSAAKAAADGKVRRAKNDIPIAGMVYIGRPGNISSEITGEFKEDLTIGEIDVSSFKDVKDAIGGQLYSTCELTDKQTNGLKTATTFKPDTFCVNAQIVYNNELFEGLDKKDARLLRKSLDKAIVQNVRQQRVQ
jgi:hypothetical protein